MPNPGDVFTRPGDGRGLVVVLSNEESNTATGWTTVCPYTITDELFNGADVHPWHSVTPSPGYVFWPHHFALPTGALEHPRGTVETRAVANARQSMRDRFV